MNIDNELITKLAKLSKLEFTEAEMPKIKEDLSKMLGFVEKLNELNTEGVEPLIYLTHGSQSLRDDEATETISQEAALTNAPQKDSDFFKVPRFLNKKE